MLTMEGCKPTSSPMVRKECGNLDVFQETSFRFALRGKISGDGDLVGKKKVNHWWSHDAGMSVRGRLVSDVETNNDEQR